MDNYPEVNVAERECQDWTSSRHDSASSIKKAATITQSPGTTQDSSSTTTNYTSFPSPSSQPILRTASTRSSASSEDKAHRIDAEYARYTDAPPPYSETQYQGKSEQEQSAMRLQDYAKELSRIMGRQIVRGMKIPGRKEGQSEKSG